MSAALDVQVSERPGESAGTRPWRLFRARPTLVPGVDGATVGEATPAAGPAPDGGVTDEQLLAACRTGSQAGWAALVRRHTGLVFRVALRSARRRDEAEDLTQEIFWKVSRTLHLYDHQCPFRPWLLQVARRHLIDHHRSRAREKQSTVELDGMAVEPGATAAEQHETVVRGERARRLHEALRDLPDALRDAVVLRDVEGLEYDEIAAALDVPLGTVKSRINRGRLQLAVALTGAAAGAPS